MAVTAEEVTPEEALPLVAFRGPGDHGDLVLRDKGDEPARVVRVVEVEPTALLALVEGLLVAHGVLIWTQGLAKRLTLVRLPVVLPVDVRDHVRLVGQKVRRVGDEVTALAHEPHGCSNRRKNPMLEA